MNQNDFGIYVAGVQIVYHNTAHDNADFNVMFKIDWDAGLEKHLEICRKYLMLVGFDSESINDSIPQE